MFRLAQTVPDGVRALMQAGGSPFDVAGRRPTYRIRMACKKYMRRFAALPWGRNWALQLCWPAEGRGRSVWSGWRIS